MAFQPRLRVFAGPNGSGKSTMYKTVKETVVNGRSVDLGVYLNPDDIAHELRTTGQLDLLKAYGVRPSGRLALYHFAKRAGLLRGTFDANAIRSGCRLMGARFILKTPVHVEAFAQLLTAYLCEELLRNRKKFSFETVFSHPSKVDLMARARKRGYKVYLYFIATNSAELNIDRVRTRVEQGGHDVPVASIQKRYGLSLQQLLPAIDLCYHAFVFDNTGPEAVMFAEMKRFPEHRSWAWVTDRIPDWFIRSYLMASKDPVYMDVARRALEARKKSGQRP